MRHSRILLGLKPFTVLLTSCTDLHIKISPTPIFTFCLRNYKCMALFTKQFLPNIAPKRRNKDKFRSTKTQNLLSFYHACTSSVKASHAAQRSISTYLEYSEQTLPGNEFVAASRLSWTCSKPLSNENQRDLIRNI